MLEKYAFIDTSIFLNYRSFDEIDWLSILAVKNAALVLAPITVSELNQKKDEGTAKLRQRAGAVLKKVEQLWSQGQPVTVRPGVELVMQDVEPLIDYPANQLDYRCQDDRLLAAILQFRLTHATSAIVLVADDFGLRVKAVGHGIEAMCLPEEMKLPQELDPNERRIQELEREVLELKRVMPELKLAFRDGSNRLQITLEPPVTVSREEIEQGKKLVRLNYPKLGEEAEAKQASHSRQVIDLTLSKFMRPSKEDIDEYNGKLEQFYKAYSVWLETKALTENRRRCTVQIDLALENNGTAPAEDIDLFLHFPDGFELYGKSKLPRVAEEPKAPAKPEGGLAGVFRGINLGGLAMDNWRMPDLRPQNVSSPEIRRTESYEVNIHVGQLKHELIQPLEPMYVVFAAHDQARSFGFDFRIVAGNIPRPTSGTLHVVVGRADGG